MIISLHKQHQSVWAVYLYICQYWSQSPGGDIASILPESIHIVARNNPIILMQLPTIIVTKNCEMHIYKWLLDGKSCGDISEQRWYLIRTALSSAWELPMYWFMLMFCISRSIIFVFERAINLIALLCLFIGSWQYYWEEGRNRQAV